MSKKSKQLKPDFYVHPTALVEDGVKIGKGTKIWHFAQVRGGTVLGENCIVGNSVFIDSDSQIGDNCKIQNHAIIYHQAIISDGVFIGPNVCFTNDKRPRAINPDGTLKSADDWDVSTIKIGQGAAIGGHSTITPGSNIGQWAMAGSGSVITKDVPDFALVYGNPAKIHGFVCKCGQKLEKISKKDEKNITFSCACGEEVKIPKEIYKLKVNNNPKRMVWIR